jgi:lipoprotein-releasing system permease protein
LLDTTLSAQAHIVVKPAEEAPRPQVHPGPSEVVLRQVQPPEQRLHTIPEWPKVDALLRAFPGVVATAPSAVGAGFARQGNASYPVTIMGIDAFKFDRIIPTEKNVIEGRYLLESGNAVLGKALAANLGVGVGDRVRVQTAEGSEQSALITGLLDMGNQQINERWVVIPLRDGQTLLGLEGAVSLIYADVSAIFSARAQAAGLHDATGLVVDDWMSTNQQLLSGLKGQADSTNIIRLCVMFAIAIGIASVLAVSVVQRSREIGILRAIGVPSSTMGNVFLLQGMVIGVGGWLVGSVFAVLLVRFFSAVAHKPDGTPLFTIPLDPSMLLSAGALSLVVGALAAVLPARRAASLEPAVAIRHV